MKNDICGIKKLKNFLLETGILYNVKEYQPLITFDIFTSPLKVFRSKHSECAFKILRMYVQSTLNGRSKALNGNVQGDAQLFPRQCLTLPKFVVVNVSSTK